MIFFQKMKIYVCLVVAFACQTNNSIIAADFCLSDRDILTVFFRTLIEESEAGYVINNKKPLCFIGYITKDDFATHSSTHSLSVAIKEAIPVWNRIKNKNNDVFIHIYSQNPSLENKYNHLLIINRPLFLKTVKDHLPIFQYILGPTITPEGLLDALIDNSNSFFSVLKGDKTLIGIILGYGLENAIYVKRIEEIQEALLSADIPPFKNHSSLLPSSLLSMKTAYLFLPPNHFDQSSKILMPSTGYSSISKEYEALVNRISLPPDELISKKPTFLFGCLNDRPQTNNFFSELINTQKIIRDIIDSEDFLDKILLSFGAKIGILNSVNELITNSENNIENTSKVLAKGIFNVIVDKDSVYKLAFIDGLRNPFDKTTFPTNMINNIALKEFKKNYMNSDRFFQKLAKDTSYQELIPLKLYVKQINAGYGKMLSARSIVNIECACFDPENKCLSNFMNIADPLDLDRTIPAFAYALKGMKEGERREIFIHPSLAYGIHTFLEKGIYIKADVSLLKIYDVIKNEPQPLSPIPEDYTYFFDSEIEKKVEENLKNEAKNFGGSIAKHLFKDPTVNIEDVIYSLNNLLNQSTKFDLSEEEEEFLNRFHWKIYFGTHSIKISKIR